MRTHRKRTVEKVAEEGYWEGFFACLENDTRSPALEFSSGSGLYGLNEVRRIAHRAGWDYCSRVLKDREDGKRWMKINREVPGKVMAECYGEARVG